MTPTQPAPLDDAGAMAVLDRLREAECDPYGAVRDPQARASIAAEAADTIEALVDRATHAEAELAAVRAACKRTVDAFDAIPQDNCARMIPLHINGLRDAARGEGWSKTEDSQ